MERKILLFLCLFSFSLFAFGQNLSVTGKVSDANGEPLIVSVTGKVSDANGEPLIGVAVLLKGSNIATQTNALGNYTISVPSNGTLVFTYLGYTTQEIAVNNRTVINTTLTESSQSLEQVVVIGYGTQRKRDLTGSITSIKGEDIEKSPNVNPISSLQGKVAGLTIVNNGTPGSQPTVRIRGVNSTNSRIRGVNSTNSSSADPIYVVDGVIQTNIDYVNQGDIESIEVLKDPSSTAIFGVQGGNGVIVITTKRAAKGQTRISLQSSAGIQTVPNRIDVVDAAGFRRLYTARF